LSRRLFSERFLAATRAGDRAQLTEMLHPDFELEEAAGLPYGGLYHGVDGWLALGGAVVAAWRSFRMELLEFVAETDDSLVVRLAISGRSRKTDRPFESTVLELWRFKDDRLHRIHPYYFDTHLLALADSS
jgi:ketosteroid isomerase-like protein